MNLGDTTMYVGKKEDFSVNMKVLFKKPDGFFENGIIVAMLTDCAVVKVDYSDLRLLVKYSQMSERAEKFPDHYNHFAVDII